MFRANTMSVGIFKPRKAFTLIELLVVVAIIVVLVAILLPSLGRAREQAKGLKCGTQLRQIGAGMYAYAAENNSKLPPPQFKTTPADERDLFLYALWTSVGYAKESWNWENFRVQNSGYNGKAVRFNVFNCPVSSVMRDQTPRATAYYNPAGYSYAVNTTATGSYASISTTVQSPAMAVLLESGGAKCNWTWPFDTYTGGYIPHQGATNVLFLDGHVESRKYKEIPYKLTYDVTLVYDIFWKGN